MLLLNACSNGSNDKQLVERVTLWRKDKNPYGAYYAFENVKRIFPNAELIIDKRSPVSKELIKDNATDAQAKFALHTKRSAQIILSNRFLPSAEERQAIFNYVFEGNQLFLSGFLIDRAFLDSLKLSTASDISFVGEDSLKATIHDPLSGEEYSYTYPGRNQGNFFSKLDTGFTTVLGRDGKGRPNFVKISYQSGGTILIHLSPLVFSNFFLLHKENKSYYDRAFSYLHEGNTLVSWNDYFRYATGGQDSSSGNGTSRAFKWILSQPALATALWILLALVLLILLFESKRRQHYIPTRPPLRNTSLDFVKTIGRLYFQRKDNRNLAIKMTNHWLEYIRNRYTLPTSKLDEDFEKRLAFKTGIEKEEIHALVYQAKYMSDQFTISDGDLLIFNYHLENFYKKA